VVETPNHHDGSRAASSAAKVAGSRGSGRSSQARIAPTVPNATNPDAAESVVAEIVADGGTAQAFVGDVADPEVAQQAVAAANAPVGDYPVDSWRSVIEVNLNAVFYGLRALVDGGYAAS
jgi:NAD(P)-dependent dehydrogenase (short-subunit alcohol dehydrogenase family)